MLEQSVPIVILFSFVQNIDNPFMNCTDIHNSSANGTNHCKFDVQKWMSQGWIRSIHLNHTSKYDSLSHQIHSEKMDIY